MPGEIGGLTTQFIYDGDGNLVKKIKPDSSKTLYVGGIYEVDKNSGGTVTGTKTYYAAGGARGSLGHACFFIQEFGATPLSQLFPQIEIQDGQ